ncbi:MAG TPA: ethanolamine ammonia-lyase reactivating factor EutA [Candidatus Limnocylindria bacterium]|nr:ethanolamine ammonia-lyase reactivating factor EutA [Candidatus Limnocylindria bacterium]
MALQGALEDGQPDDVVLRTVGIDIGSTTSHAMFARLRLQRLADVLSSRYVVVERLVVHRSSIALTPYRADGRIDAVPLRAFLDRAYADSGTARDDIDTGAVILTGAALERDNARELADLFATEGGKFVCATAGPSLEATLAAHGSGSVTRSARDRETILHLDIGGGTSKLALIENGVIVATSAVAVGARLIAFDERGRITRLEAAGRLFLQRLGLRAGIGDELGAAQRERAARSMVAVLVAAACGAVLAPELQLLDPLPARATPARITLSGGVAEYVAGRAGREHDDLGPELGAALLGADFPAPLELAREGIRATVIGAAQFTVQVSGSTISLEGATLPLRNVPVVPLGSPLDGEGPLAISVRWTGEPEFARIRALAERIAAIPTSRRPLVVAIDGDIAATLGAVLRGDLGVSGGLVTLDGLDLGALDYVDIGVPQPPSGVIPVIVKSLVFPHA